jgi:hypothetical protein
MAAAAERNARAARDTAVRHEGSQAFVASAVRITANVAMLPELLRRAKP